MQPGGAQAVQQAPLLSNVRADAGALGAAGAAAVQAGQTVQRGAEFLAKYALEKQAHVNRGILAREETLRGQTAEEVNRYFNDNRDRPETWGEVSNKAWAEYEKGRESRMKAEKWGTDVAQHDGLQLADFREKFGVRARAEQDKAYVQQANARIYVGAKAALNRGDVDGFKQKMATMNLEPMRRQEMTDSALMAYDTDVANARISGDPFRAAEEGFDDLKTLSQAQKVSLQFRATKAANIARAEGMREMAQKVADATNGAGEMPSKEELQAEAKRMGISPKFVEALLKPPAKDFDQEAFAEAYNVIAQYDPQEDNDSRHLAHVVAMVEGYKGGAKERLNALLTKKLSKEDSLTAPVVKHGEKAIRDAFEVGAFGTYKDPTNVKVPIDFARRNAAAVDMARAYDLFYDWVKKNPNATYEQAAKFVAETQVRHVTQEGSDLIIDATGFNFLK